MKALSFCTLLLSISLFSMSKIAEQFPEEPNKNDTQAYDSDLFRKNVQVYAAHVEFLYWTMIEGALDYALKMNHAAWSANSTSFAQGHYQRAGFDLDPGFRLGLHFFRAPNYWELKWQYTRMTSRGENSASKPDAPNEFLTGTWPQAGTAPLANAKSWIHFNYNVFDMLIDRVFFPNPHLRLRVIGGTTLAWMSQDWKVRYTDTLQNSTTLRNRWDFIGGGLKTGSLVDWYWTGDLYMTGLTSLGVLIGTYSNHAKQTTTVPLLAGDNTNVPIRDAMYDDVRPTFTAQMILGPSWQKTFCSNRIEVFAGFEMNLWFNLAEVFRSTGNLPQLAKETWINSGLLALYGLTTRLTCDF